MFEVETPTSTETYLAILPNKFKSLIWVKRNDFVIVEETSMEDAKVTTVRFQIRAILNKQHVKHLQSQKKWPVKFMTGGKSPLRGDDSGVVVDDVMPDYVDPLELGDESEASDDHSDRDVAVCVGGGKVTEQLEALSSLLDQATFNESNLETLGMHVNGETGSSVEQLLDSAFVQTVFKQQTVIVGVTKSTS